MKTWDIIILISAGVLAVGIFFGFITMPVQSNLKAIITVKGEEVSSLPMDKDDQVTIHPGEGQVNDIVVKQGEVYVEASNCPSQVCVHTKPIRRSGQIIVCLPHELMIEIVGDEEAEIDGLSQ